MDIKKTNIKVNITCETKEQESYWQTKGKEKSTEQQSVQKYLSEQEFDVELRSQSECI